MAEQESRLRGTKDIEQKKKPDVSPAMGKKPLWSGVGLWLVPQVANYPDRVKRMS